MDWLLFTTFLFYKFKFNSYVCSANSWKAFYLNSTKKSMFLFSLNFNFNFNQNKTVIESPQLWTKTMKLKQLS